MYLAEFENSDIKPVLDHFGLTVTSARVGVYGTLRKDGGANQLLEGLEYDNAFVLGGGTYMFDTGAFPFVVTGRNISQNIPHEFRHMPFSGAYIELYKLPADNYEDMLSRLDAYEGVPHLYKRSYYLINGYHTIDTRKVIHEPRLLIYYTWNRDIEDNHIPVPGGDWLRYKAGNDPYYKAKEAAERRGEEEEEGRDIPHEPAVGSRVWMERMIRGEDTRRVAFDAAFIDDDPPDIDEDFDEDDEVME